jgi:hypothetical protein
MSPTEEARWISKRAPRQARRAARAAAFVLATAWMLACARPPAGPAFTPERPPPPHRARLYVYRADDQISLANVRIEVDGRAVGRLSHGEYETLELSAGPHRLRAGLRGPLLLAWGWNEHPLRLTPGETAYLRVSVRLSEHAAAPIAAGSSTLDIAGRGQGVASENVFIELRPEAAALEELRSATRRRP